MIMEQLLEELLKQIDLQAVLVIQGATAFVKFLLNVIARQTYTDWVAPFVAVLMGQLIAWAQYGLGVNAVIYGFKVSGGAIIFNELYKRFIEGVSWFRKGTDDPALKAKVEQSSQNTDAQINKIKSLLTRSNKEDPK